MAELHLLGFIKCATNFRNKSSLFCRYSFQSGPNWTIVAGLPEGQTVSGKPDQEVVIWQHPFDLHFMSRGIQGWPRLLLHVGCLDSLGRTWNEGYSYCNIPSSPGHHELEVQCWVPSAVTFTDKLQQYFIGGSHELMQQDIVSLASDRYKLKTESKGSIQIEVDIILRNFKQFGVEYK